MITDWNHQFKIKEIDNNLLAFITGKSYDPKGRISHKDLRHLTILHHDFQNNIREGSLIAHHLIAEELIEIFSELFQQKYQIEKIRLIDYYNADDDLSMAANNSSCFNYRYIAGTTQLSKHSLGCAVDINPAYNPYIRYEQNHEIIAPPTAQSYIDRTKNFPHKIDENDLCYQLFTHYGYKWGGHFSHLKDYHHFEKTIQDLSI